MASGAIAGLFGAGGGLVLVPALTLFTDCGYKVALGTSFAVMLPTSLSGATAHFRQGTMSVKYAAPLSVGCLVGSVAGSRYGKNVDEHYLSMGFSVMILGLGVRTLQQALRMV